MKSQATFRSRFLFPIIFLFIQLYSSHVVAAQPRPHGFLIESVLSPPFTGELVAAPNADIIAWTVNHTGRRSIWIARAPQFEPQKIVSFDQDDGRTLHHLVFGPHHRYLFFVRGDGPNQQGEFPNPNSDPRGAEQWIWLVDRQTGKARPIVQGHTPVPSPNGKTLLFIRKGRLFHVPIPEKMTDTSLQKHTESPPEPFLKVRGRIAQPHWSPDGSAIVFVSQRGDHSFIGLYDVTTRKLQWIAPSVYRDTLPTWSPDGRKIAFIRFPGLKKHEHINVISGLPFSLLVFDREHTQSIRLWSSPGADGGFAQYYPAHPLFWFDEQTLGFTSEHEGWLHLYRLKLDHPQPEDLTPGEGFTEFFTWDKKKQRLIISSNHHRRSERRLFIINVRRHERHPLTPPELFATHPVALPSGRYIAFRASTALEPSGIYIFDQTIGKYRKIFPVRLPPEFPREQLVTPKVVHFRSLDGLEIEGQLFRPRGRGPHPAVIFMHGGPIRQMLPAWHYLEYYARAYAFNQYLTAQGFVVLSVNYRSGIGYGRAFRQAPHQGPRGASEYQDIVAAGLYLRRLSFVDPERIGLWGGSYGGYLTAMGLSRDSDLFRAGVDLHGVHDWSFRATDFIPGGAWGLDTPEELKEAYASSPVADLSMWKSPVLLIHGDDDRNVMFAQTVDLYYRLKEKGVHVEVLVLPDEVHGFLRHESWLRAYRAAADFFLRMLGSS